MTSRSKVSGATVKPKKSSSRLSCATPSQHFQASETLLRDHFVSEPTLAFQSKDDVTVFATQTIVVEGASKAELRKLKSKHGMELVREGSHGKVLMRAPEDGLSGVIRAFDAANSIVESGGAQLAHPNFVRLRRAPKRSTSLQPLWNHLNDGRVGIAGADVAARAAWTITTGNPYIRVAVLDEGVDATHVALRNTICAQIDFVDGKRNARPDGNDAHGTACAGIIVSQSEKQPGLAPRCRLVAVRIAKGNGFDEWIFDDFNTADAIDWSWKEGKAHVLSNSWGGGPPADILSRAFERARLKGRDGKGCVIVCAAGNSNSAVQFPATLPGVLAVGASNPWDERKSPHTKDGETGWGSCYGKELSLVAPGVGITTTDISGTKGYSQSDFINDFNGTSSACPHVAAAAALVLSVKPDLPESSVREIILKSVDKISASGRRTNELGAGRLNLFQSLRLAQR